MEKIVVTGGAGYVGSELVKHLLQICDEVVIYDTFWYSNPARFQFPGVTCIVGDIRDSQKFKSAVEGANAVIHLASISNDPSFELDPVLSKAINFDCFENLVKISKDSGVERFIFASSSSVYGVKEEVNVVEDMQLNPLTDYSKYKMLCEQILNSYASENFIVTSLRPATVCGVSSRLRLDVVVNILSAHAFFNRKIKVFGGSQKRPNIHIHDMCRAYVEVLKAKKESINAEIFNVGTINHTVDELACMVQKISGVENIEYVHTNDNRSYHINSDKIKKLIGFECKTSIEDAVAELFKYFKLGHVKDPFLDPLFHNVLYLKKHKIT